MPQSARESQPPSRLRVVDEVDRRGGGESSRDESKQIAELVGAIRKNLWLVLGVMLLALFAAAAYGLAQTKIYRASATLQLDPRPPRPLGENVESVVDLGSGSWWAQQEYYNTQHKIIASKRVALAVVAELGLANDGAFLANKPTAPDNLKLPVKPEVAAAALGSRLSVMPVKESRIVEVAFEDADKERATRILEAVVRAYMTNNLETATQSTTSAVEWLSDQLETLQAELSESELALHEYKLDKNISSIGLDDQSNILKKEMEGLAEARTVTRAKVQAARARVAQIKKIDPSQPSGVPQTELLRSDNLLPLRNSFAEAEKELVALAGAGKGENHPDVLSARARRDSALAALVSELRNIQIGAERDLAALEQEDGGLSGLLAQLEKKALDLNLMEIEYNRLARTKENNEKLYSLVLERTKEASLTQALRVNNIQVMDAPAAGGAPVKPRLSFILMLGGLAGLGLGLGVALVRERLDRSVKNPTDVEERLGMVLLGHVPTTATDEGTPVGGGRRRRGRGENPAAVRPELAIHVEPKSGLAESIRAIRTNVLFMSPDKPFRRLLVTSPVPAEGKTTIACYLAITMAQAGHKVLLVDCDMRKPRVHQVFPTAPGAPSLSESLLTQEKLDKSLLATEVPNLSALAAGPPPPNPAELLHSESFRLLLRRLDAEFDLIILDTPPLIVTDAAILSTQVDGSILVLRAHETDRVQAARAQRALRDAGGTLVGAILNGVDIKKQGYGYGGQYYYRGSYGSYGSDTQSSS